MAMNSHRHKPSEKAGEGLGYGKKSAHGPNTEEHDAAGIKGYSEAEKRGVYGGKQFLAGPHEHGMTEPKHMPHEHTISGGLRAFWQGHGGDKSDCKGNYDGSATSELERPL